MCGDMLDMRRLDHALEHNYRMEHSLCFLVDRETEVTMANENDGTPWSDDDLQTLKTLITENTPPRLVAMKLGRTEDAIRDKVKVEGLSLAPTNRSPRD